MDRVKNDPATLMRHLVFEASRLVMLRCEGAFYKGRREGQFMHTHVPVRIRVQFWLKLEAVELAASYQDRHGIACPGRLQVVGIGDPLVAWFLLRQSLHGHSGYGRHRAQQWRHGAGLGLVSM